MRITPILAALAGALVTATLHAQAPNVRQSVRSTPSCPGCRIELTKVVSLGEPSDSVLLNDYSRPYRDARGRYYAWGAERGRIAVYDAGGRFMRTIGRSGQGPGEFRVTGGAMLSGPGDSLRVYSGPRMQVFDPDYRYARGADLPTGAHGNGILLADGRTIYPFVRTQARDGPPLHVLSPDGAVARSFGVNPPLATAGCLSCSVRLLAASPGTDRFWAGRANTYQIEQWTTSGELTQVLVVDESEWFPARIAAKLTSGELRSNRTTPHLAGVWEDSARMLWVLGGASRSGRVDETNPPRQGISVVRPDSATLAAFPRRTIIEVIDPARRTVVASTSLAEIYGMMESGHLYSRRSDANGYLYLDIWKVSLRRP